LRRRLLSKGRREGRGVSFAIRNRLANTPWPKKSKQVAKRFCQFTAKHIEKNDLPARFC
jgi:hypothetical protein